MAQWYRKRSTILTNKNEAKRIANNLRDRKYYSSVRVVPRVFKEDRTTGTSKSKGYWIKVDKK